MRRRLLKALTFTLLSAALLPLGTTATAQAPKPIRIAAAADLQPLLPALLAEFAQQTGRRAEASYASSATLAIQIQNGAPFDLFLSADMGFPERVAQGGFAASGAKPAPYARGTLVLWARGKGSTPALSMEALRSPAIRTIAIANPQHAPYGRAAVAALKHDAVYDAIVSKIVLGENISQTAQFVQSGNADVGIIALSLAMAPKAKEMGIYAEIPAASYPPIVQAAVIVKAM